MQLTKQFSSQIDKFIECLSGAKSNLIEAARRLVKLVDEDDEVFEKIIARAPEISVPLLERLEMVGRNELHPSLLFDTSPVARRIERLPFEAQAEIMEHPIEVAVPVKNDSGDVVRHVTQSKRFGELTLTEANVVVGNDGVRKVAEQVKIRQAIAAARDLRNQRYVIIEDRVHFFHDCEFSASELEGILGQVKSAAVKGLEKAMRKNQV